MNNDGLVISIRIKIVYIQALKKDENQCVKKEQSLARSFLLLYDEFFFFFIEMNRFYT